MMEGKTYFEMKIQKAAEHKKQGNQLFKAQQYEDARNKYQEALVILQPNSFYGATEIECQQLAQLSANLLFNVGTCFFNQQKWKNSEVIYSEALTINPNYTKALFKRAMARYEMGSYDQAMQDVKKAYNLDRSNKDIREGYEKVSVKYNEELKKDNQKRKEMSSKMFNTSPKKSQLQQPEQEGNNWWVLALGVPLAVAAIYQGIKYLKS